MCEGLTSNPTSLFVKHSVVVGAVNQASFLALGHIWVLHVGRRTITSKALRVRSASSLKQPWASWRKNATRSSFSNMSASHVLPVRAFLKTTMGAGCWASAIGIAAHAMAIASRRMLRRHLLVLQVSTEPCRGCPLDPRA